MATEHDDGLGEVYYEFSRVGNVLRVCAIDPVTNTEVVMVGAPEYSEETLMRFARRKLAYVINKKRAAGEIR